MNIGKQILQSKITEHVKKLIVFNNNPKLEDIINAKKKNQIIICRLTINMDAHVNYILKNLGWLKNESPRLQFINNAPISLSQELFETRILTYFAKKYDITKFKLLPDIFDDVSFDEDDFTPV